MAVDYGWEVKSSDAWEALNMWKEAVGDEQALDDIAQAMGTDELEDNLEYIFRVEELGDFEDYDDVWDAYDYALETVGAGNLLDSLAKAMGTDELAANLVFIFRMNDFRDWDEAHAPEPDDDF